MAVCKNMYFHVYHHGNFNEQPNFETMEKMCLRKKEKKKKNY